MTARLHCRHKMLCNFQCCVWMPVLQVFMTQIWGYIKMFDYPHCIYPWTKLTIWIVPFEMKERLDSRIQTAAFISCVIKFPCKRCSFFSSSDRDCCKIRKRKLCKLINTIIQQFRNTLQNPTNQKSNYSPDKAKKGCYTWMRKKWRAT